MVVRTSAAEWHGRVQDGGGSVSLGSSVGLSAMNDLGRRQGCYERTMSCACVGSHILSERGRDGVLEWMAGWNFGAV